MAALRGGENQYAPLPGVPALREAVLDHQRNYYGLDPEDVLITFGATEAIAAALLGLCDPGDEVVVLEPYYDSYAACIGFAGARRRPVTLRPPGFEVPEEGLRAAIGSRARVLLLNSPHNPTGRVLSRGELELIAAACIEHDLICVTDEVYEHLVYDGEHIPIATLPGMASRTLTISSVGKSFSFTGWKVGWCSGPAQLVAATRTVKQYLTFAGGTPLQHAAAAALRLPPSAVEAVRDELRIKRDQLCEGLDAAGLRSDRGRRARTLSTRTSAKTRWRSAPRCHLAAGWWRSRPAPSMTTRRPAPRSCDLRSASAREVIAEAASRLAALH